MFTGGISGISLNMKKKIRNIYVSIKIIGSKDSVEIRYGMLSKTSRGDGGCAKT